MKLDGVDIAIEKTNRRKTVSIFIERDGSVRVLAPVSDILQACEMEGTESGKSKPLVCQRTVLSLFWKKLPFTNCRKSGCAVKNDRRLFSS